MKTKMRYYYTLIKMAKIQILTTPNAGKNVEQRELSFIAEGTANGTVTLEDWQCLTKLTVVL